MNPIIHSGVVSPVPTPPRYRNRAERRAGDRKTRKLRRALGLYDPIYPPAAFVTSIPRYIRRHHRWLKGGTTRKHRRERARVLRITRGLL